MTSSLLKLTARSVALITLIMASALMQQVSFAETVTATLAAGTAPEYVAVNPLTNKIYVAIRSNLNNLNNLMIIDGATNSTTTLTVGTDPRGVAVNPATGKIYVANYGSNSVSVIDGATNGITTVNVGSGPQGVAVNPVTNRIYVTNTTGASVTVIDGTNNNIITTVGTGTNPYDVAINPVTNKIYVVNNTSGGTVTIIDGATNAVTNVNVGTSPRAVAVNPVTNKIYVANRGSNNVTIIDGAFNTTVTNTTVPAGTYPYSVAVNPVTNMVYVANYGSTAIGAVSTVTAIDGATNGATNITVQQCPNAVAVNPVTNRIYVANEYSASATVIDGVTNSTSTLSVGSLPRGVAVSPITNKIYVTNRQGNNVTVIDGATNSIASVTAGTPRHVVADAATNKIYVSNNTANSVTIIDGTNNSTSSVATGTNPYAVALNPITKKIYVTNAGSADVTVIDGATGDTASVAVGTNPYAVAVNPVTNRIYVANRDSNTVTVIDGATNSISTVAAGSGPWAVAVNPVTNRIYVANGESNNVTVIDGITNDTATVAVGMYPYAVAVNQVSNKVYVANYTGNNVTVIDGSTNGTTSITAGTRPYAIALNTVTNRIYVANDGSNTVTVINGATNGTTGVPVGASPRYVAVNQVTNKVYVANWGGNVTIIDGATNVSTSVAAGTNPFAVALNPVTNKVYVANYNGNNVTVLAEQLAQVNPLTTAITPLDGNRTTSNTPSFTLTPTNAFSPNSTGAPTVYYQLDTWQGAWLTTQPVATLPSGLHILYAFAVDAQSATSTNTGHQGSPLIGTMTAYQFLVAPIVNYPPVIAEGASTSVNMSKDGTPVAFSLTLHATDANADAISWGISGAAAHGTASASGSGASKAIGYTPTNGYYGPDSFIVQADDGNGGMDSITVNVTINQAYTVDTLITGNGSITPNTPQQIDSGASTVFVVTPDVNSYITHVTGCGGTLTGNSYLTGPINATCTVTANFTTVNSTAVAAGAVPVRAAVNPVTNKIYVANFSSNNVTVIDGATNSTATVAAGTGPQDIAVNPVTNKIYVANYSSDNITVIDGTTNIAITVAAGTNPNAVAVNPVTNRIYVTNRYGNSITIIDGATNSTTSVAAGTEPCHVAVNPVTNMIYVANYDGTVTVIDGETNSTVSVAVGLYSTAITVNPATNKIYVANYGVFAGIGTVTIIDGATNATVTVNAGSGVQAMTLNPVTNMVYVANIYSGTVTVIDGLTNDTSTVTTGAHPYAVALNPVTNRVYVAFGESNTITVIDGATNTVTAVTSVDRPRAVAVNPVTNKVYVPNGDDTVTVIDDAAYGTSTLAVGTLPYDVAVNPVTNKVYVANSSSASVTVIDGNTNGTASVATGTTPRAVAVNPITNKAYVANYDSNSVTVIDGATNDTATVAVGTNPYAVTINPVNNKVYVANAGSSNVTVIDGATNSTSTAAFETYPWPVALNPVTNREYVANWSSNTVSVIDKTTSITATVNVGTNPWLVAVNPVTNKIYVTNFGSDTVSVIDGTTNSVTNVAVGVRPRGVIVNPVTNRVYVTNTSSNTLTVLTEQQTQANPLTTAITPLAGNTTSSSTPSFTLTPTNGFTPNPTGALNAYYQLDTWQGPWLTAQSTPALTPGLHILYAFAADAQAATSTNTGSQSSPLIGTMAAYQFLVAPITNNPPVITEGASTSVSMSKDSTPSPFSLTLHATDADGDALTWSIGGAAAHGTANASGSGASVVVAYTPTLGYVGPDSFVVQVDDGQGGTTSIAINVTVIQTYTLSFVPGGNGALTGTTSQTVNYGASPTEVTAIPATGYHFVNWTGTGGFVTTTANPLTVSNVTASMAITANFVINTYTLSTVIAGTGGGKATSDSGGIDCGPTCSSIYNYGTSITLTATPDATSTFTGWSGSGCSGTGTCQVTMDAAKSVTATFTRVNKTMTVATSGSGSVTSTPGGIDCGAICSTQYLALSIITLTPTASTGHHFSGWGGACSGSGACNVTMDADRSVTASFAINTYSVTASPGVNGSLDATTPSPATVNYGSTTSFKFNADSGYYVSSISGCGGSSYTNSDQSVGSYTYTTGVITGACTASATFAIKNYTVIFTSGDNGTLTGTTSQIANHGSSTTEVTAEPVAGYHFVNWTGTGGFVTTTANPLTISNVTTTMTITANFAPDPINGICGSSNGGTFTAAPAGNLCTYGTPTTVSGSAPWTWSCTGLYGGTTADCTANIQTYTLTVTKSGAGNGTVSSSPTGIDCGATCTAQFPSGSVVILQQAPYINSGFSGWGDACSGTGDCAFSMSSDKGVTANFISSPLVKNQRSGVGYGLLQTAYSDALDGDTIKALTTLPTAGLTLDAVKSLTIEGGYASDYASCPGLTTVSGPVTVKAPTRMSGLAVRAVQSSTRAITAFNFASPAAVGIVDEATHSITITAPSGTNVTALVPIITHTGAGISPTSGTPQDFTSPVVYTVTAEDLTTQNYTVTVTAGPWAACGDILTYAGENYPTVQIGTQCWFAKNLNIGLYVTATSLPDTSCSSIQKFCYGNSEGNCATYGGLYTWNQAMCGAQAESAQGLCPSGWHVPSDPEFVTLVNYLGPGGCNPYPGGNYPAETFCGAPAGDRMKTAGLCQGRTPCGNSGFNAILGGAFGYSSEPVFSSFGDQASFWTSSGTGGGEAWRRGVALDYSGVDGSYFWTSITGGRSIRCVKD